MISTIIKSPFSSIVKGIVGDSGSTPPPVGGSYVLDSGLDEPLNPAKIIYPLNLFRKVSVLEGVLGVVNRAKSTPGDWIGPVPSRPISGDYEFDSGLEDIIV